MLSLYIYICLHVVSCFVTIGLHVYNHIQYNRRAPLTRQSSKALRAHPQSSDALRAHPPEIRSAPRTRQSSEALRAHPPEFQSAPRSPARNGCSEAHPLWIVSLQELQISVKLGVGLLASLPEGKHVPVAVLRPTSRQMGIEAPEFQISESIV